MTAKKLYETSDSSLNVTVEFQPWRFLFGFEFKDALFTSDIRIRMITLHLWCFCFCFTGFSTSGGGVKRDG